MFFNKIASFKKAAMLGFVIAAFSTSGNATEEKEFYNNSSINEYNNDKGQYKEVNNSIAFINNKTPVSEEGVKKENSNNIDNKSYKCSKKDKNKKKKKDKRQSNIINNKPNEILDNLDEKEKLDNSDKNKKQESIMSSIAKCAWDYASMKNIGMVVETISAIYGLGYVPIVSNILYWFPSFKGVLAGMFLYKMYSDWEWPKSNENEKI